MRVYGTAATIVGTQTVGALPTRNFQQGTFDGWEAIGGQALSEKYLVTHKACHACPIGCGRVTRVSETGFEGRGEGPEYETIYAMGSNCGVDNLAALTKANYICNEQGMDTISMGSTIACAMELFENGVIAEKDIGRPLRFGDAHGLVEMTRLTAERKGFGALLAMGSYRLAAHYGHPERPWWPKNRSLPATTHAPSRGWAWPTPLRPSALPTCGAIRPTSKFSGFPS